MTISLDVKLAWAERKIVQLEAQLAENERIFLTTSILWFDERMKLETLIRKLRLRIKK